MQFLCILAIYNTRTLVIIIQLLLCVFILEPLAAVCACSLLLKIMYCLCDSHFLFNV